MRNPPHVPVRALLLALAAPALLACTRPPADTRADAGPRPSASAPLAPSVSATAVEPPLAAAPPAPAASTATAPSLPHLYGTRLTLPLTRAAHGVDGALRLLEDTRVRKPDPDRPPVTRDEPGWLHARLELLDAAGAPVDARVLWTTLAEVRPLGDVRGQFFVTLDPECFASRWCGPDTQIVEVSQGKLVDVVATDLASGKELPIRLRQSIPEGWRTAPAERGGGLEIFQVQVAMSAEVTAYVRYTREGDRWVKRYQQRRGGDSPGNPGNEEKAFERGKFPELPPR